MTITGYDANGIPRVYGEHTNPDVAETMCREQAIAYVRRRPDSGPLAKWIFMNDAKGWTEGRIS